MHRQTCQSKTALNILRDAHDSNAILFKCNFFYLPTSFDIVYVFAETEHIVLQAHFLCFKLPLQSSNLIFKKIK